MAMFIYGTKSFTKNMGFYGPAEECPCCHKSYSKTYVKISTWAHLDYIPLFPVKFRYFKSCPICGIGVELTSKEGKAEMQTNGAAQNQNITYFGRHILKNKPKGLLATDTSFEFWAKDGVTGEEFCISQGISKDVIKNMKKMRGVKNLPVYDIAD